ncbi:MAG: ABC transporter ATP-binding protein, partial [Pseudomonadota bacterium]
EEMCDRIGIINHGKLVACDDTASLIGRLDAKTILLRLATPLDRPPEVVGVQCLLREPNLLALTYSRSRFDPLGLIDRVRNLGHELLDVSTEEPDLEEVFLNLTSSGAGAR